MRKDEAQWALRLLGKIDEQYILKHSCAYIPQFPTLMNFRVWMVTSDNKR